MAVVFMSRPVVRLLCLRIAWLSGHCRLCHHCLVAEQRNPSAPLQMAGATQGWGVKGAAARPLFVHERGAGCKRGVGFLGKKGGVSV
jgi:hypothetical protein